MSHLFEAWKPVSGARVTGRIQYGGEQSGIDKSILVFCGGNVVPGICNVSGGNWWDQLSGGKWWDRQW